MPMEELVAPGPAGLPGLSVTWVHHLPRHHDLEVTVGIQVGDSHTVVELCGVAVIIGREEAVGDGCKHGLSALKALTEPGQGQKAQCQHPGHLEETSNLSAPGGDSAPQCPSLLTTLAREVLSFHSLSPTPACAIPPAPSTHGHCHSYSIPMPETLLGAAHPWDKTPLGNREPGLSRSGTLGALPWEGLARQQKGVTC